jgi:hypothetical protein
VGQHTCFRFSTERFCRETALWSPTDVTLSHTGFVMKISSPFLYAQVSDRTINRRLSRYNIIIHLSLCSVPCVKSACMAQPDCQMANEKLPTLFGPLPYSAIFLSKFQFWDQQLLSYIRKPTLLRFKSETSTFYSYTDILFYVLFLRPVPFFHTHKDLIFWGPILKPVHFFIYTQTNSF